MDLSNGPFLANHCCIHIAALIGLFRLIEIVATSVRLHILERYETNAAAHALTLTLLAFLEVTIAFGVLYLYAAIVTSDPFGSKCDPIWKNPLDAFYFSTVTMATIGYGDYSPTRWFGKLLVILQAFTGLLLVVVAFQRVLSGTSESNRPARRKGPR